MSKRFETPRNILRILGSILGIGLLGYQIVIAVREFSWTSITPQIIPSILAGLGLSIAAYAMLMLAWKVIMSDFGYTLPLVDVLSGYSISFVTRYIPGTIWGYLSRGEWLKREHKINYTFTNLGSLIETFGIVVSTLVLIAGVIKIPFINRIPAFFALFPLSLVGGWAFINLCVTIEPIRQLLKLKNDFKFSFIRWSILLILFTAMWCFYGWSLSLLMYSITPDIAVNSVLEVIAIYAAAWLVGFLVLFMPSGLGLREYILTFLLTSVTGLPYPPASVVSIGFRLMVSLAEVCWVMFGLLIRALYKVDRRKTPQ